MIDAPLALAFTAGMVAAFNPCGFALLPAYLSYFLGTEGGSGWDRGHVGRAIVVGAAVTAGFVAVFGAAGVLVTGFSLSVQPVVPWLSIVIGAGLAALGVAVALGFHPRLPLPHVQPGGRGRGVGSMALFGVSYAVVSVSCTLPVFLAAVATVFDRSTFASGVSVFAAYAGGMGTVLIGLTVAVALAHRVAVARVRRVLPFVSRAAGVLLAVAGTYAAWYAWYGLRVNAGDDPPAGPIVWVSRWSADISERLAGAGPATVALAVGALVAIGLALGTRRPAPGAGGSEQADGRHRPDPDERPADDQRLRNGPEEPAVTGVGAVVAHHPQVLGRHSDLLQRAGGHVGTEVGLFEHLAVDEDLAVTALHRLPGEADHPFDQVLGL